MIKLKLNNPTEEFCIGLYCHAIEKITLDEDEQETSSEMGYRIVLGFLIFSIEIIW